MQITLKGKAKAYVEHMVRVGCHPTARDLVDSLLQDQAEKLSALRAMLDAAEAEGGEVSEEELDASLAATLEELKREGIPE